MPRNSHRNSLVVDLAFRALGDPTRRAIIEHLSDGPATVSELAADHDMALPSFVQHLEILKTSGLITSTKKGRVRTCKISTSVLKTVELWIESQRTRADRRGAGAAKRRRKP
jgi:DNA-binding transcriptional ArsR family regulator